MDYREIITRIDIARQRAGLSARELSGRIGKNENYISKLVSCAFSLKVDTLLSILEVLDISAEQFFYQDFENYQSDRALLEALLLLNEKQRKLITALFESWKS